MGHIRDKEFAPELVQTLNAADSLSYVYSDAIDAIHALEESADEFLLSPCGSGRKYKKCCLNQNDQQR
jgi:uncharacterized protein YecA (UPF0149 family)